MEEYMEISEICGEIKKKQYIRWDIFLVRKWSNAVTDNLKNDSTDCIRDNMDIMVTDEMRKTAYKNFYKAIKKSKIVYPQTYKKWFAADSGAIPKRWQILKLALALGLSPEETQEYLTEGISEPEIQVNDYQEFICMYCLANNMSIEDYNEITECFEANVEEDVQFQHTEHTNKLKKAFEQVKTFTKEEFTVWMIKNQKLFKGYSMTTYRYFESLIDETVASFRRDAQEMLAVTLQETSFHTEVKTAELSETEYREAVKKFIKNSERRLNNRVPDNIIRDIKQYYVMAYSEKGRISVLLSEIFDTINQAKSRKKYRLSRHSSISEAYIHSDRNTHESAQTYDSDIPSISAKYISELLNISLQKEKLMNMIHALRKLDSLHTDDECPEAIWQLISDKPLSVSDGKKLLKRAVTMQGQRTKLINRTELLILLSYVIQDRYTLELNETGEEYDMNTARTRFVKAADSMLTICGMRTINKEYYIDAILLACYGRKGIYQFAELLEML